MATISVRLDDEAMRALGVVQASGLSRSEAVRQALTAEAERLGRREALRREVADLEADEADRAQMLELSTFMESMRAPR
ncbi:MAG: ribbon-helix-helix protein, CopG family [Sporichthyaceae bacterium]